MLSLQWMQLNIHLIGQSTNFGLGPPDHGLRLDALYSSSPRSDRTSLRCTLRHHGHIQRSRSAGRSRLLVFNHLIFNFVFVLARRSFVALSVLTLPQKGLLFSANSIIYLSKRFIVFKILHLCSPCSKIFTIPLRSNCLAVHVLILEPPFECKQGL